MEQIIVFEEKLKQMPLLLLADPSEYMVKRYLETAELYVLRIDGEVVGEAAVTALSDSVVELKNLAVQPKWQGKGCGSQIVNWLLAHYSGKEKMLVGTSQAGTAFYKRLGFRDSHRVPRFFLEFYPEPIFENGKICTDMFYLEYRW